MHSSEKHKEALEALVVLYNAKAINTDNETMGAAYETVKQALQAASWQDIETAPRDGTEIRLKLGEMTILGKWETDGFLDENCKECGGWFATREGEHPPCWSGGVCWTSNEEESPSISPTHWMPAAPVDGGG